MIILCKICKIELTTDLLKLSDFTKTNEDDGKDFISEGNYIISDGECYTNTENKIIINKNNLINTKNHSIVARLNGCCGLDGQDGLNKVCSNNHEIGIEFSDCWLPHSVIFEPANILTKELDYGNID